MPILGVQRIIQRGHYLSLLRFVPSSVDFFWGFIPQKTTFITITISTTTVMDTQKPMLSPNKSAVPNSVIQISFQFIVNTSFYSSSP